MTEEQEKKLDRALELLEALFQEVRQRPATNKIGMVTGDTGQPASTVDDAPVRG